MSDHYQSYRKRDNVIYKQLCPYRNQYQTSYRIGDNNEQICKIEFSSYKKIL